MASWINHNDMENPLYDLPEDGVITLKPFEIITVKAEI